jgi:HD-like signal output (HDOD) protein
MPHVAAITEVCVSSGVLKQRALQTLGTLPPFSPILNRLMATLAGDNASFSKLGDLMEKDTVIAGNLLRMVNSAMYARRGTVNSVRHALTLLGIEKVRNAVLGMSLSRMWSKVDAPLSWSMARFDMHSAAVAILSDMLAQKLPVEYPEGAFVAGLLHDLGRLLIAIGLPEQHDRIDSSKPLESELEILGFTHAELSADALAVWNLPEPILLAVRHHHDVQSDAPGREGVLTLSAVVATANNYVNSIGVAIAPVADTGSSDGTLIEKIGLDPERLEATLEEFRSEYELMIQYFRQGS